MTSIFLYRRGEIPSNGLCSWFDDVDQARSWEGDGMIYGLFLDQETFESHFESRGIGYFCKVDSNSFEPIELPTYK